MSQHRPMRRRGWTPSGAQRESHPAIAILGLLVLALALAAVTWSTEILNFLVAWLG